MPARRVSRQVCARERGWLVGGRNRRDPSAESSSSIMPPTTRSRPRVSLVARSTVRKAGLIVGLVPAVDRASGSARPCSRGARSTPAAGARDGARGTRRGAGATLIGESPSYVACSPFRIDGPVGQVQAHRMVLEVEVRRGGPLPFGTVPAASGGLVLRCGTDATRPPRSARELRGGVRGR